MGEEEEGMMTVEWERLNLPKFMVAICAAAVLEDVFVYPLSVLKTRQQVDTGRNFNLFKTFHDLFLIHKHEGFRNGLFRGFWSSTLLTLPSYAFYFILYHRSKYYFSSFQFPTSNQHNNNEGDNQHNNNNEGVESWKRGVEKGIRMSAPMSAAIIAEVGSNAFIVPADVIVLRLQVVNSPYKNARVATKTIWKEEGIKGFYRGFGATLLTFGLSSSIWWMTYEYSKPYLSSLFPFSSSVDNNYNNNNNNNNNNIDNNSIINDDQIEKVSKGRKEVRIGVQLAAGFIAGVLSTVISNPLDVVKTRLQTQHVTHPSLSPSSSSMNNINNINNNINNSMYKNTWDGMKWIIKNEGYKGFTRGMLAKTLRFGPISALSSVVYEQALAWSMKD